MTGICKRISFQILSSFAVIFMCLIDCQAATKRKFVVKEASCTRMCSTQKGDMIFVVIHNKAKDNITIHWHGVKQPRNIWSNRPKYIGKCPSKPGERFSTEEGTVWWNAHNDWARATDHGAIIVHPKHGTSYALKNPHKEVIIILGEWCKKDVKQILEDQALRTGGAPNVSGTFRFSVERNNTYLVLKKVNAGLNTILFFSVAHHKLTVLYTDGGYKNPLSTYITIFSPGQTIDALLLINQKPGLYYMAARAYSSGVNVDFNNTTTTTILEYKEGNDTLNASSLFPFLPYDNESKWAFRFNGGLRSLADQDNPINMPTNMWTTMATLFISSSPCEGTNGTRFVASILQGFALCIVTWSDIVIGEWILEQGNKTKAKLRTGNLFIDRRMKELLEPDMLPC